MQAATMTAVYSLCPFPAEAWPLAWSWLQEFPLANFDDTGRLRKKPLLSR